MNKHPLEIKEISSDIIELVIATDAEPYLKPGFVEKLTVVVHELNAHKTAKVVLVTAGEKYFSAGASQDSLTNSNEQSLPNYVAEVPRLLLSIKMPTIAVMAGHAIGGGLALGLWCDFCFLAEESLYGANFMSLGFTPGMGSTIALEEGFGKILAREMILTGRLLKGRALKERSIPLSQYIFTKNEVLTQAENLANSLTEIELEPLLLLKKTLAGRRRQQVDIALAEERSMHEILFSQEATRQKIAENYAWTSEKKK